MNYPAASSGVSTVCTFVKSRSNLRLNSSSMSTLKCHVLRRDRILNYIFFGQVFGHYQIVD